MEVSSVAGENIFLTMGGKQTIKYALAISVGNTTLNKFYRKVVLSNLLPVGEDSIVLLHRSPIKLYFASEENAQRCHYSYDKKNDVCPVTGRVFRYGGLRGKSKFLVKEDRETN